MLRSIRPTRAAPDCWESSVVGCARAELRQDAGPPSRGGTGAERSAGSSELPACSDSTEYDRRAYWEGGWLAGPLAFRTRPLQTGAGPAALERLRSQFTPRNCPFA
jgi:hypothetical protein